MKLRMEKSVFQRLAVLSACLAVLCTTAFADMEGSGSVAPGTSKVPSPAPVSAFPDVPANAEYAEAANALYQMGIFTGDSNGNFNPNSTITRAEMAAIICRMVGVEDDAKALKKPSYKDVPASHWAVGYIAKATELGIINGYGNGKFGPGDPVTYEHVIKMLICAWGYESIATEEGGYPDGYIKVATDLGITTDVIIKNTSPAPRGIVSQLVYNTTYYAPIGFVGDYAE